MMQDIILLLVILIIPYFFFNYFFKKIIRKNNEKEDKNKISYQEMIDQYDYEGSPKFKKRKKILTQYLKEKGVLDDDKDRKQDE
jgi:hypothetical protein